MNLYINDKLITNKISNASSFHDRFLGLMFKKNIEENEGLLLKNCNWIHTMFMNFSIDVIYLDSTYRIVNIDNNVKPWRFCKPSFKAKHVLEMGAGFVFNNKVDIGGILRCSD